MEEEKNTQAPTITDAVTYIVDKDGNRLKPDAETRESVDAEE